MASINTLGIGRDDALTVFDEFTGFGGSLQGILKVPGTRGRFAANHDPYVIDVSRHNYPDIDHFDGDVQRHDITKFVPCHLFSASPACPKWTSARGVVRDFDQSNQEFIPGLEGGPDEATLRSRLLMDEVHRYLAAMWVSGQPVLAGMVENVVECRKWDQWKRWLGEFHKLGYKTRVIAFNSMHAEPVRALRAPQSRDRLYVAYWLEALGRDPDWDKWLRPTAWCPRCDETVRAVQVFKDPRNDMGRYKAQYVYRCPKVTCRGQVVEPEVLGAYAAIDWSLPSTAIGQRDEPLAAKTMARIGTGVLKFAVPHLAPAGGTWRTAPSPVSEPMPARTTRESDGVALPPLLVPVEGRPGKEARPTSEPARTQTCRNETGLAVPPFMATLRGGGSAKAPATVDQPLTTVTASGNHHGLAGADAFYVKNYGGAARPVDMVRPVTTPLGTVTTADHHSVATMVPTEMLVSYYGNGSASPAEQPVGTLTTRDRYGRASTMAADVDAAAVAREIAEIDRISSLAEKLPKRPKGEPPSSERLALEAQAAQAAERMVDAGLGSVAFRMLEPNEIRRAMAFSDDHSVPYGTKRAIVRGYGNAVTAPVAEVVFSALTEAVLGIELERTL
jgi:DNA (cytosine-5)-methyltransferase 1